MFHSGIFACAYANISVITRMACCGGIDIRSPCDVFLQNVVLHGARQLVYCRPAPLRHPDIQRQQDRRRRVDGHRRRDPLEIDAREQPLHVFDGIDRHPDLTHLAQRHGIVGVIADLSGQVECHRQPRRAVSQQELVSLVRFFRIPHSRILPHGPEAAAVHRRLHPAGERELAGRAQISPIIEPRQVLRRVGLLHLDPRTGFHSLVSHRVSTAVPARNSTPRTTRRSAAPPRSRLTSTRGSPARHASTPATARRRSPPQR